MGIFGSVAKFCFWRKIEFLGAINSMTYRIPHTSKTNFATEPFFFVGEAGQHIRVALSKSHQGLDAAPLATQLLAAAW